jgi:Ca2+-binding RTX toxin-like protein
MVDTMIARTFKEFLKLSGPDRINTPMLSREERLTRYMPPIVVEMLERRRLMTLSVEQVGGTVEITGSSSADYVSVSLDGSGSIKIYDGTSSNYGAYDPNQVTLIKVLAGDGADTVLVNPSVSEAMLIYGDSGNDDLHGAGQSDTVYGGNGSDGIDVGSSADLVYGGEGGDTVNGGDFGDTIWGDLGSDVLSGGNGDDLIYGGADADTLNGNDDSDSLYGEGGDDVITGGAHRDTMYGGDGNDTFHAADLWDETIFGGAGTDSATDRDLSLDMTVDVETY